MPVTFISLLQMQLLAGFDKARHKKADMIRQNQPVFTYSGKDNKKKTPVSGTHVSIFPALIRHCGSPRLNFASSEGVHLFYPNNSIGLQITHYQLGPILKYDYVG